MVENIFTNRERNYDIELLNEWLWIKLIAASFWTQQKKIDEFEVYIAEIDRCVEHGSVIRGKLAELMKEISFNQEARMLVLALF